ncbi:MAG: RecX family transcriptional regulator [Muribaculaceae bacterium]|nr:RecX family transcriptional regulator [Muribaculaceae bacterium]
MSKKKPTADEMLIRMAGLCAASEQCSADVRCKIYRQGFSAEEAERMIRYLQQNSYLDEARYARAYAVDKVRFSGWGRLKIRLGLKGKGLGDSTVAQALMNIPDEDYGVALQKVLVSKARNLDLSDVRDRQKLYRQMSSRGFESQLIVRAMREYIRRGEKE